MSRKHKATTTDEAYFEPLVGGFSGKIEADGRVIFNQAFEWTLLDKFDIWPRK